MGDSSEQAHGGNQVVTNEEELIFLLALHGFTLANNSNMYKWRYVKEELRVLKTYNSLVVILPGVRGGITYHNSPQEVFDYVMRYMEYEANDP